MRRAWIAAAAVPAAAVAAVSPRGADYGNLDCHLRAPRCDEAGYPINALAHGHLTRFFHLQPLMGPVSLVLRAPFAAVANGFGAALAGQYRATLFPCLFVSALVALALTRESRTRGHSWFQTAAVGVLAFVSPVVVSAISAGHPEEVLAAALIVASALLVLHDRPLPAALAVGLAVASKPWAILVVVPILLVVASGQRQRFVAVAVLAVLACYAPLIAGDAGRFKTVVQTASSLGSRFGEVTPPNAWFFTARSGDFSRATAVRGDEVLFSTGPGYAVSAGVARAAHALVLALALVLTLAWWRSGGSRRPESVFLLIGAILLLRCALDPGNHLYYHAAAALALLGYEAVRPGGRVPWVAGGFIAALWIITRIDVHLRTDTAFALLYLAWAVPTMAGLALMACRRSRSMPPTPLSRTSRRLATA